MERRGLDIPPIPEVRVSAKALEPRSTDFNKTFMTFLWFDASEPPSSDKQAEQLPHQGAPGLGIAPGHSDLPSM